MLTVIFGKDDREWCLPSKVLALVIRARLGTTQPLQAALSNVRALQRSRLSLRCQLASTCLAVLEHL